MSLFGRRDRDELAALRGEVTSLQGRLSADVANLNPGDDLAARQGLADASERATAAGALLSQAQSPAEMRVVRRVVVEGLSSTRAVRERLGLPLGPDLPDVSEATPVPGPSAYARHPLPAQGAPGLGRTPFWQKALAVGGAVAGVEMLGGILDGGGDGDYDRGDYDGGDYDGGW